MGDADMAMEWAAAAGCRLSMEAAVACYTTVRDEL